MPTHSDSLLPAFRTLLRSLGQIVLQGNAWTGCCVLAALASCELRLACAALMGAVAANIAALLAGCDEHEQQDGRYGFNGALAALAANVTIGDTATAMAVSLLAATAAGLCQPVVARRLGARGLACYSSPCLLVTWCWLACMPPKHDVVLPALSVSASASASAFASASHVLGSLPTLSAGIFSGLAQTAFASGAWAGALVLAGIALSSRRHALMAIMGTATGGVLQLALGAMADSPLASITSPESFSAGLAGFNGALVALALADAGVVAALVGVLLAVALQQWTGYTHWPAMTAPFVLATWCVRLALRPRSSAAHDGPPVQPQRSAPRATDVFAWYDVPHEIARKS